MIDRKAQNIEVYMRRYEAQPSLFALQPKRMSLLRLGLTAEASSEPTLVSVWRNHSFESLQPIIDAYASFRFWPVSFRLGPYDDTFSFEGIKKASLELLWIDSHRFLGRNSFDKWLEWLRDRICALRNLSPSPIVVCTWVDDEARRQVFRSTLEELPAVYVADLSEVCTSAGVPLLDPRSEALSGTPLSRSAQLLIGRTLVCKWMAAAILPPIKCIALDLDNTLHSGVLGEEGIEGVVLTPEHESLQIYIKNLQKRGVFVALVSRNEFSDVKTLFELRRDYPLHWDDFSAIEVSWGDKADALIRIADALRISTDSILFVDDNPGELASVAQRLPQLHTLHANQHACITELSIDYYAGLWRWRQEDDDAKRISDLKANAERNAVALNYADPTEYMRSLQISLSYFWDYRPHLGRLSDLCRKTNQFNLAIQRLTEAELADKMAGGFSCVASIGLTDRLSDSGIIAAVVASRVDDTVFVEELCISCRALGRNLENHIVLHALRNMPIWRGSKNVEFRFREGDRNQPAINWLISLGDIATAELQKSQSCIISTRMIDGIALSGGVSLIDGDNA